MHVFIWHKWKGMLTWNRSLKMKHLKKGRNIWIDAINTMLWLSHACITKKYMIAIIAICPVSRYQTKICIIRVDILPCDAMLHLLKYSKCVHHEMISKSCFTALHVDIMPYDEMLQLINTWNGCVTISKANTAKEAKIC